MRALIWIVEEIWQATVAAATLLPTDTDITLLHVGGTDTETIARAARDALLGRPRGPTTEPLGTISEQSARQLLAEAQTTLGRDALLDARSGRIEHEVVTAAGTVDLLVLARDKDHTTPGHAASDPPPAMSSTTPRAPCSSSGPARARVNTPA